MQKVIGLENRPRVKNIYLQFPKGDQRGLIPLSLLDPSLVYIPHVGVEFYMNDEIIQSKANSGNKRFPKGLKHQDSVDKEMSKTWE